MHIPERPLPQVSVLNRLQPTIRIRNKMQSHQHRTALVLASPKHPGLPHLARGAYVDHIHADHDTEEREVGRELQQSRSRRSVKRVAVGEHVALAKDHGDDYMGSRAERTE
ncbi:hypothetical protein NUW58_g10045 [Xylaria curta]|uniref:Uncharacterized protein n=1 Tax=Xylaria curta TaxID=42375 RepID=A0ACC1MRM8_9PEZI|nr:hypothetical protein NUW58_g10045 [Xylaria curta]